MLRKMFNIYLSTSICNWLVWFWRLPSLNLFFSKMHHTDNPILCTLIYLPTVKYEIMGLATKYGLNGVLCGVSVIKEAVWLCFKQNVQF